MGFLIFIGYLIGAFLLFCLLQWTKSKYHLQKSQVVVLSVLYFFIVAGMISNVSFRDNLFIMIIFEFFMEMVYTTYFLGQDFFEREEKRVYTSIITVLLCFILNQMIVNQVSSVFLTAEQLKQMIWFFIFITGYQLYKERNPLVSSSAKRQIKEENIYISYAKLKHQFGEEINSFSCFDSLVLYSIMIYRDFQRPAFMRKMDTFRFRLDQQPRPLGIMQVTSKKDLDDVSSIELVSKKLEKIYDKKKAVKKDLISNILEAYTKEDAADILDIYKKLKKFCDL